MTAAQALDKVLAALDLQSQTRGGDATIDAARAELARLRAVAEAARELLLQTFEKGEMREFAGRYEMFKHLECHAGALTASRLLRAALDAGKEGT